MISLAGTELCLFSSIKQKLGIGSIDLGYLIFFYDDANSGLQYMANNAYLHFIYMTYILLKVYMLLLH